MQVGLYKPTVYSDKGRGSHLSEHLLATLHNYTLCQAFLQCNFWVYFSVFERYPKINGLCLTFCFSVIISVLDTL